MNLCTDVIDAEPRTGQKNSLCIITPDQEYYIRGDSKEIINGYLMVNFTNLLLGTNLTDIFALIANGNLQKPSKILLRNPRSIYK